MHQHPPILRRFPWRAGSVIGLALAMGAMNAIAVDPTTGSAPPGSPVSASHPTDELVSKFTTFAGTTANAQSLVGGLRSGGAISLQSTTPTIPGTTFDAPTAPMGFGNIKIALSLAQAQLSAQGITQPTPAQIETALLGGSLSVPNGSIDLPGVLAMRSAGQGWGEIAHALGFKVGDVVRSDKAHPVDKDAGAPADIPKPQGPERADRADRPDKAGRAERPERVERVSRVDRPERVERVERVERPERPERPERVERPERPERPERAERPDRGNP